MPAVYCDCRSSDGSEEIARQASVVTTSVPTGLTLSAAQARNLGMARLIELSPGVQFIQFVDGDCLLDADWLQAGLDELAMNPRIGAVWGFRSEIAPEASLFNRLADIEWRIPLAGETLHFGGDVLIRRDAIERAGGYDPEVVASEDHELSVRIANAGYSIYRLDRTATRHDSRMHSPRQWWRKCQRRGVGLMQVYRKHRRSRELGEIVKAVFWGLLIPIFMSVMAWWHPQWLAGLVVLTLARVLRVAMARRSPAVGAGARILWGMHCVLSRTPSAIGILSTALRACFGRRAKVRDYLSRDEPVRIRN